MDSAWIFQMSAVGPNRTFDGHTAEPLKFEIHTQANHQLPL